MHTCEAWIDFTMDQKVTCQRINFSEMANYHCNTGTTHFHFEENLTEQQSLPASFLLSPLHDWKDDGLKTRLEKHLSSVYASKGVLTFIY